MMRMRTHKSRLTFATAIVGLVAGSTLLVVETIRAVSGNGLGGWFWILIGLAAIVFGAYELFGPPDEENPGRPRD